MSASITKQIWKRIAGAGAALVGKGFNPGHPFNIIPSDGGGGVEKISQPYAQSVWVQECIKKVAKPIASVPIVFTTDGRGGKVAYQNPVLTKFWERPARDIEGRMSNSAFRQAWVTSMQLWGEAFLVLDDTWTLKSVGPERKSAPFFARPSKMVAKVENGEIVKWIFVDQNQRAIALDPEQVLHDKFPNPYDPIRGLSPMAAAQVATEAEYYAGTFARNIFRSNGERGTFIVAAGEEGPTKEQQDQMIAALENQARLKRVGIDKPMFLSGDIKVEDPKAYSPDAAYNQTRLLTREEIAICFGVPPGMIQLASSHSIGSNTDRQLLIEETCMPLAGQLADTIERLSAMYLGLPPDTVFAQLNFSEHTIMQTVRQGRIDSLVKLAANGMPVKDANQYLQLGMQPFPGWEIARVPMNLVTVGQDEDSENFLEDGYDEAEPEDIEEPAPTKSVTRALEIIANKSGEAAVEKGKSEDQRIWEREMRRQRPAVKMFHAKLTKALFKGRVTVLRKLAKLTASKSVVTKDEADDAMFDREQFAAEVEAGFERVIPETMNAAGRNTLRDFGSAVANEAWTMPPMRVMDFLNLRKNLISGASDGIFQEILDDLRDGFNAGDPAEKIAARIKTTFKDISDGRAMRIAITEAGAAYNSGSQEAAKSAGIDMKRWLSAQDERVRPDHAEASGQEVGIDGMFVVGDSLLSHPGDPRGPANEVINCRCVSIPFISTDKP